MKHIMKPITITLFLAFHSICIFSQQEDTTVDALYSNPDYFHEFPQEKFFLHTNKTTYFTGESIWWKAYIVSDFSNRPTTNTTNLHVSFYNSEKTLVSHQLFYVDAGKSHGELTIPNHLATGTYHINVGTQWHKNFNNPNVTSINIINPQETPTTITQKDTLGAKALTIQFYPESGTLLNNINNTVFYTVKDAHGRYVAAVKATVVDNTSGQALAKLESNAHGQGKFNLIFKENHTYTAVMDSDGQSFKFGLPQAKPSGMVIQKDVSVANEAQQKFVIYLTEDIAESYHNQNMFATIHRNNSLRYVVPIPINKLHKKYVLPISTDNVFEGVNTITLFNESNQPLAERHFYHRPKNTIELDVVNGKASKDSLQLAFQLKGSDTLTNVSISVLPKDSRLNMGAPNILEAFMAAPYLNARLPLEYELDNDQWLSNIDVFLQNHAVSTRKTHLNSAKPYYGIERGLTIKGVVNTDIDNITTHSVLLSSTENEILLTAALKPDRSFEFHNLVLRDSANYSLALLNAKGELIKAGFYVYKQNTSYMADPVLSYQDKTDIVTKATQQSILPTEHISYKDAELLDEVVLHGKKRQDQPIESIYPNNPKELGNGWTKSLPFDEHQEITNTVVEFLNNQVGLRASENFGVVSINVTRGTSTLYGGSGVLLLMNNFPVDKDVLYKMPLSWVKSIRVNSSGAGYGMQGRGGVVLIETKKGDEKRQEAGPNPNYFSATTDFGFSGSLPVFEPSSLLFNTVISRAYYETLDWTPNFNIVNGTQSLNVYRGEHSHIKLYINGMNSNGQLLYKVVDIAVE